MRKTYLLDASVLLSFPRAIFAFDEHEVVIPSCVIDEIGDVMRTGCENRANAIEFTHLLDSLYAGDEGPVPLPNGGFLRVALASSIFSLARTIPGAIVVSRDAYVRLKAKLSGLNAEPYRSDNPTATGNPFPGRSRIYVSEEEMSAFARDRRLSFTWERGYVATDARGEALSECYRPVENEYLTLVNAGAPQNGTMLGRYVSGEIVPVRDSVEHPVFGVSSRNVAQVFALDALMDPNIPLVILRGPAGTGKTFLSMAAALQQTLEDGRYRRILLTRPNAKMDADVGYLKGDEKEKMLPSLRGLIDNIDNLMPGRGDRRDGLDDCDPLEYLMSRRLIEVQALAYMRGRSIANQFILVDEMQNSTVNQVLSIITRLGENSKLVIMGDPDQIDNPYLDKQNNGLVYAADRMAGSKLCCQVSFMERESTRSPLAREAVARLRPKGSGGVG